MGPYRMPPLHSPGPSVPVLVGSLSCLSSFGCERSTVKNEKNQLCLALLSPAMPKCSREKKKKYLGSCQLGNSGLIETEIFTLQG